MRFHVLGLFHTQTTREYSSCAFTQKVRLLCKMLVKNGHHVIHYGNAGSDPECTENVEVLDAKRFYELEGHKDWRKEGFNPMIDSDSFREWTAKCIEDMKPRVQERDFILCPFGMAHQPQAAAFPQAISVESGIGYNQAFANFQVFESYAWMHTHYGADTRRHNPRVYDAVIPNYLDMEDYPYSPEKGDYFIHLGRPIPKKGSNVCSDICEAIGAKLYVAGWGGLQEGVKAEHLGNLSIEDRAKWVGGAKALFVPTYYVEPFGTVAIEAMAYGTPVIATDWGVFNETVIHGYTGYRFRTIEQGIWAARNIGNIKPINCRKFAESNYSLDKVGSMYEEYFQMLHELHRVGSLGFYQHDDNRTQLDWLNKKYEFE